MEGNLPKDPLMLLSVVNMQLRDHYPSLEELCSALMIDREELERTHAQIDYLYDKQYNQFV